MQFIAQACKHGAAAHEDDQRGQRIGVGVTRTDALHQLGRVLGAFAAQCLFRQCGR